MTSEEDEPDESSGPSSISTNELELLIEDAQRIIDHQIEFARASDEENRQLLRYNLLIFAAFATLLAYGVDVGEGSSFVNFSTMMATVFIVASIGIAASKFVSKIYGGFGDSPKLRLENIRVDIDKDEMKLTGDESAPWELPGDETAFRGDIRHMLLADYQRGISHNNHEAVYRVVLQQRSIYLLVIAVVLYSIGAARALKPTGASIIELPLGGQIIAWGSFLSIVSWIAILVGILTCGSAVWWIRKMSQREDDENRMVYAHYDPREDEQR